MSADAVAIEQLTHRLSECPGELLGQPFVVGQEAGPAQVRVEALLSDVLEDLGAAPLTEAEAQSLVAKRKGGRNHLRSLAVVAWLLHEPWFRARAGGELGALARSFVFSPALVELAALVAADTLVADPDRREELARLCVGALGLVPAGERPEAAADRLRSLSSAEKERVLRDTRGQQERAKQLREQMLAAQAREAAARYTGD